MGQCVDSENASISSGAQNIMRSINAQLPIMLSANAYKLWNGVDHRIPRGRRAVESIKEMVAFVAVETVVASCKEHKIQFETGETG